jgi:UDP-3-O-[3-hydroxymyristoyl] glucosamine N-acyltransferase
MKLTLSKIAEMVNGELHGQGNLEITGVSSLQEAEKNHLSFVVDHKYYKFVENSNASAFLIEEGLPPLKNKPYIVCKGAYLSFINLINHFTPKENRKPKIHNTAFIHESAKIGKNCYIGPFVVVDEDSAIGDNSIISAHSVIGRGSIIGDNVLIHPSVNVLDRCIVGNNTIIHSGTVIGSDGFGYAQTNGKHIKIPHTGRVVIGNDVEIGANCTLDRGTVGDTIVSNGTKIDNSVQVAHNVKIGENCLIIAQSGISGSATIEENVIIAGQSGIVGHLTVGKNSIVAARSVVTRCLPENSVVAGFPAKPKNDENKIKASLKKLPELLRRISKIEKKLFSDK